MNLENEEKWNILHSKVQQKKIVKTFKAFRDKKIEPILIKGFSVERFYPKNVSRLSFDIDICVSPNDYVDSQRLLESQELNSINIDLHKGLRHLDKLSWDDNFENSELIFLDDVQIRVLAAEDLFRVMCVHWLTDGGENKKKLWDIYYLITNSRENFDWNRCFGKVSETRKNWMIYTVGLVHNYLDLDLEGFPYADKAQNPPAWLDKNINKIWERKHPFIPLDACFSDTEMFFYQLRLRLSPNPIMALVGLEEDFDKKLIFPYQIRYFLKRSIPSINSILKNIKFSLLKK